MFVAVLAILSGFIFSTFGQTGFNIEKSKKRCFADSSPQTPLYNSDFHWGYTPQEMAQRFEEIYSGNKRLFLRAFFDSAKNEFRLYLDDNATAIPIVLGSNFIKNVTLQIEASLAAGYGKYVFFPDMGHSHLYFPTAHWNENYKHQEYDLPLSYAKMLNDPLMKPLYHTAEQLGMINPDKSVSEDPYLKFRYWHRNILGTNNGSGKIQIKVHKGEGFNTVRHVAGHEIFSSGYNISSSKNGCFPYKAANGEILYFDISLVDLPYDPAGSGEILFLKKLGSFGLHGTQKPHCSLGSDPRKQD